MINIMSQALISNAMNPTDIKSLLDEIYNNGSWLGFSQRCIRHRPYIIELQKSFHSFWIEKGHRNEIDKVFAEQIASCPYAEKANHEGHVCPAQLALDAITRGRYQQDEA